jgi:transposase
MKGKESVICKKFRRIFRNAGYTTFLVNEFRTSKLCNYCNEELEYFLERPSKKPKLIKEGKTEICHGLLRCQSIKQKCEKIHNRDKNAVQNMLHIVSTIFKTGKRPEIFCRAINS